MAARPGPRCLKSSSACPSKDGVGYAIDDTYHLFKNAQVLNGITEEDIPVISVFPNPSNGKVHVRLPHVLASGILTLFAPNGRACLEVPFRHADQLSFDPGDLAAGTYVIEVRGKDADPVYRNRVVLQ